MTIEEQEKAAALIVSHEFKWCRARLLHALAGAAEQGILEDVLEELMPASTGRGDWDGYETGSMISDAIVAELQKHGWHKP